MARKYTLHFVSVAGHRIEHWFDGATMTHSAKCSCGWSATKPYEGEYSNAKAPIESFMDEIRKHFSVETQKLEDRVKSFGRVLGNDRRLPHLKA